MILVIRLMQIAIMGFNIKSQQQVKMPQTNNCEIQATHLMKPCGPPLVQKTNLLHFQKVITSTNSHKLLSCHFKLAGRCPNLPCISLHNLHFHVNFNKILVAKWRLRSKILIDTWLDPIVAYMSCLQPTVPKKCCIERWAQPFFPPLNDWANCNQVCQWLTFYIAN